MRLLRAGPRYSIKKVIWILFLSIFPLTCSIFVTLLCQKDVPIATFVHTGNLQTNHLAELLELSCDCPTSFRHYNTKKAEQKLLASALFSEVKIKKVKPNSLSVKYTLRKPVALLANCANTAVDQEGVLFPLFPTYHPHQLPKLILDVPHTPWGKTIALDQTFFSEGIEQVDLTHPREIILKTSCGDLVRLEKSTQQLPLYYKMRREFLKKPSIVDLRLKECAFIQEIDE